MVTLHRRRGYAMPPPQQWASAHGQQRQLSFPSVLHLASTAAPRWDMPLAAPEFMRPIYY